MSESSVPGVDDAQAASPCGNLIPVFQALNDFKRAEAQVCNWGSGLVYLCITKPKGDDLDRKALCSLFCCCLNNASYKQNCVDGILKKVNAYGNSYFKVKLFYAGDGSIVPSGTYMSRSPDVVIVKDPAQPATYDNIQKVYELKFNDDYYRWDGPVGTDDMTQKEAYKRLFPDKIDNDPMSNRGLEEKRCDCSKDEGPEAKELASKWVNEANKALSSPSLSDLLIPGAGRRLDPDGISIDSGGDDAGSAAPAGILGILSRLFLP